MNERPQAPPAGGVKASPAGVFRPSPAGVVKRSIAIAGHSTSVSLEEAFWQALRDIARARGCSLARLVVDIDQTRNGENLSSAIRVFVLNDVLRRIPDEATTE